jgi:ubiquinone/menaquinone biosynthesis C-methylase UbiE
MPYGRKPVRENALCPNCLALERHRLLWLYLNQKTDLFTGNTKFLHIAPELCFLNRLNKQANINYITGDLESPLAKVKMDVHKIPFDDDTFDAVMCNHVMEHVEDDVLAMKEIYRVLRPGGWAIMQVPFMGKDLQVTFEDSSVKGPREREKVFGQSDHVRIYGRDYPQRIRSAGFEVTEDDFVHTLDPQLVNRFALPAEEMIYFAVKRP